MVTFDPATLGQGANDFVIYHMAVQGPINSDLLVFQGATFYDTTERGDINSWDANTAFYINGGNSVYYYWNSAAAGSFSATPIVTVWMRQPGTTI
jgi:hypothetical protein